MDIFILPLVVFGMIAVCTCFFCLFPLVAKSTLSMFVMYVGEESYARFKGNKSGSAFIDPNDIKELQQIPEANNGEQNE
jgi:hypothetical protein